MDRREIGRFVQPLRDGHDLVRGSRFLAGGGTVDMSPLRRAGNRGFLMLARMLYGVSRSDLCYGYAAFRRSSIMALGLTATGFEIEAQLFLRAERAGLAVTEVPSFEAPRRAGTSNLHAFRDGRRVLRTILAERFRSQPRLDAGVEAPVGAGSGVPRPGEGPAPWTSSSSLCNGRPRPARAAVGVSVARVAGGRQLSQPQAVRPGSTPREPRTSTLWRLRSSGPLQ